VLSYEEGDGLARRTPDRPGSVGVHHFNLRVGERVGRLGSDAERGGLSARLARPGTCAIDVGAGKLQLDRAPDQPLDLQALRVTEAWGMVGVGPRVPELDADIGQGDLGRNVEGLVQDGLVAALPSPTCHPWPVRDDDFWFDIALPPRTGPRAPA
jgi:hypothetical protein